MKRSQSQQYIIDAANLRFQCDGKRIALITGLRMVRAAHQLKAEGFGTYRDLSFTRRTRNNFVRRVHYGQFFFQEAK